MRDTLVVTTPTPAGEGATQRVRLEASARQISVFYIVLLLSVWSAGLAFHGDAPDWLSLGVPAAFTALGVVRLLMWWRAPTVGSASTRHTYPLLAALTVVIGVGFATWVFALLVGYGGPSEKAVLVFSLVSVMTIGVIATRQATRVVLWVALLLGVPLLVLAIATQDSTITLMAVHAVALTIAVVVLARLQRQEFERFVTSRAGLQASEAREVSLSRMIEDMPVAVMIADAEEFRIQYINEASRDILRALHGLLDMEPDDVLGMSIDRFHRDPAHQRALMGDPANLPYTTRIRIGDELADIKVTAIMIDGVYFGPMLTWEVVTERVAAEQKIHQLARFDTPTGLPNRTTFFDILDREVAVPDAQHTVLFIDVDDLKTVNDTLGHQVGDALLLQVVERIRRNVDGAPLGRLGGDEFAVLLPHADHGRAEALASHLLATLSAPYSFEQGRQTRITASIGISYAPEHGGGAAELISRAELALYSSKEGGRGRLLAFCAELEHGIQHRSLVEERLRAALEIGDRLFVYYQDIIDLATGRITARESLIRWHDAELGGWVSPVDFVPIAEKSDLIEKLGAFVLSRATRDAAGWEGDVKVAVNVSARQLGHGRLVPLVTDLLRESKLPPHRLELEITETALFSGTEDGMNELRTLSAQGVRVALDDFGTGFSSLSHLRSFPFDKIKIDSSFVQDALSRPTSAAVVRAVAELGQRLGVTTVAEGVETQEHVDKVIAEGCAEAQGFFYSRPGPRPEDAEAVALLDASRA